MVDNHDVPRLRSLAVWLAVTAAAMFLLLVLLPVPFSLEGRFDELLVRVCTWALVGCVGWLWLVTTIVVASALRSGTDARVRGVPAPVRRLILLACGAALTTGVAAPALATPGPATDQVDHSSRVVISDSSHNSDRAEERARPQPPTARPPLPGAPTHVVQEGDSLWDIAASRLPDGADDTAIAAAWQAIYALNRDVVGPDPDVLQPGQQLELPRSLD